MENLIIRSLKNLPVLARSVATDPNTFGAGEVFSWIGGTTRSGHQVNHQTALSLSAVFNAVDQISNDIAKLPKGIFVMGQDGDRFRDRNHPADYLISKRPNKLMTQSSFHKTIMVHAILRGNGVAIIERNGATGAPSAFQLVDPDNLLDIRLNEGELFYKIRHRGVISWYSGEDIFHVPGFSFNGITGVNIFRYAAQNLGAALSAETFADENFQSRGLLAGIIKTDKQLNREPKTKLANAMETRLSKGGSHNIGVLDEGMDFKEITANAAEASLIDWKKISIEDVARWFNIAPHKIKHLERSTFSNIEQQSIEHGSDTIGPWAKKFEEEYDTKLFSEREKRTYYVKFNTNALVRTDIKTKSEYYSRAVSFGWITRNEVREFEDMNRIDGLDEPLTPSNTQTSQQIQKQLEDGS